MRIITCEHAGNKVPAAYKNLFEKNPAILKTHEAYDIGAAELARGLAKQLNAAFFLYNNTRLLIDVNRSIGHPRLFSRFSGSLDKYQKSLLFERYKAYRFPIERIIKSAVKNNDQVLHISVHSFTPVLNRKRRNADIGLLYDPTRQEEARFCGILKNKILAAGKNFRVRCNYPYQGKSDSLVNFMRNQLPPADYIGIELEINQALFDNREKRSCLKQVLRQVFSEAAAQGKV